MEGSAVSPLWGVEGLGRGQRLNSGRQGTEENRGGGVLIQWMSPVYTLNSPATFSEGRRLHNASSQRSTFAHLGCEINRRRQSGFN